MQDKAQNFCSSAAGSSQSTERRVLAEQIDRLLKRHPKDQLMRPLLSDPDWRMIVAALRSDAGDQGAPARLRREILHYREHSENGIARIPHAKLTEWSNALGRAPHSPDPLRQDSKERGDGDEG